ncbi:hypothetical protein [Pseudescherichia sp.]|uniref:hypothetical protein n=1 Tax=Pseudescherichia sp. TaxID=2055881 RepID=UPI0028A1DBEF|nr:hypothetical protein [Pseudescherichia sp.]
MTVEYDAVYVADLDPALPADTDGLSQDNDHIMLVKQVIQNTFPSATTALVTDLNYLNQLPTRIAYITDPESDVDSNPSGSLTELTFIRDDTAQSNSCRKALSTRS